MSSSTSQFGQNQWLVDEMYQKFKQDPSSVDASWHEFLADYTPEVGTESGNSQAPAPAAAATPPPAAAPAAAPAPAAAKPALAPP
ncbi:2-oxoglutarate dehydrogenase E1 subunit family protein, partial [Nocardia sp. NPDC003354]